MLRYILVRLVYSFVTLAGVSAISFGLVFLSGDPVLLLVSESATKEEISRVRHDFGYDRPVHEQYWRFVSKALKGDLGRSLRYDVPAMELVMQRLPATALLATLSIMLALAIGITVGVIAARRPNSVVDQLSLFLSTLGQSMPVFWFGILMVLLLAVQLQWLPPSGYGTAGHIVMPAVTLSLFALPKLLRVTRNAVLEVRQEDYVRTAYAKGLQERAVLQKHVLRNAAIPIVTLVGLEYGGMFGGSVVTETIFSWPGLGRLVVEAVRLRDFVVVQSAVLVIATIIVVLNLATDVLYSVVDPRVRL